MFIVNEDNSIYATRGDVVVLAVTAEDNGKPYMFQPGEVVRIKVFGKKDCETVVLKKDFLVTVATDAFEIFLDEDDTKIDEVINKPKDYWYEVELNPDTNPQTIIGYDDEGAKVFRLFPEGADIEADYPDIKPEDIPVVDKEFDYESERPVANRAITSAIARLEGSIKGLHDVVTPEMFGAAGDGETDDSKAIAAAMKAGKSVLLKGTYAVGSPMSGSVSRIYGEDAKIVLLNDIDTVFRLQNVCHVSGLSFLCNNHGARSCVSVTDVESVEICNISIKDVKDMRKDFGSLLINVADVQNVNIHDINIENCNQIKNGSIGDSVGNMSGIYVTGYENSCTIQNVSGKEIHNIDDDGNIVFEDSNLIYVTSMAKAAGTIIRNIYGYNFGKRLIKTQCNHTVIIDGVHSYSNSLDHLVTIGIQSTENVAQTEYGAAIISNCVLENAWENPTKTLTQELIATSEKISVFNCKFISPQQMAIVNLGDLTVSNCDFVGNGIVNNGRTLKVDNVTFSGVIFLTSTLSDNVAEEIITNSKIKYVGSERGLNYDPFAVHGKNFYIANIVLASAGIAVKKGDGKIHGAQILEQETVDAIHVYDGAVVIDDVSACSVKNIESLARAIIIDENGYAEVKNCTANGYTYVMACKGSAVVSGGVELTKIHSKNAIMFKNYPEYVDSLPHIERAADGTRAILTSDNKLYTLTNGSWVAV